MLVAEHERVAHDPDGWHIAVVVLRYFAAVLMLGEWARASGGVHRRHRVLVGPVGLQQTTYGLETYGSQERPKPAWKACDRRFRAWLVEAG